jgi:protein-S-isoprenylcysteine O-methyltransferase Ste14
MRLSCDETHEPTATPPVAAIKIFNTVVPLLAILFAGWHLVGFVLTLKISIVLLLAKAALELHFYVPGATGPFVSTSAYAYLIAFCGTVAPLMLRPADVVSDFWIATVMQVIGLAMLIYVIRTFDWTGKMSLTKHGIEAGGLYRLVRHPLYLALMFCEYGYVLNHTNLYNLCVLVAVTFFQVLRIKEEERLMLDDKEFQKYAQQTPWRVIPGVF